MMSMMVMDINNPLNSIEWLCVIDHASLWWEIQRYRTWKIAIVKANRAAALANALYKSDPNCHLLGRSLLLRPRQEQTRRNGITTPAVVPS